MANSSPYPFVTVRGFTPNPSGWTPIGPIASWDQNGNVFTLQLPGPAPARSLQVSFLSATCFRVRFNPMPGFNYAQELSYAVVKPALGAVNIPPQPATTTALVLDSGAMRVRVELNPYRILVFRPSGQLIHSDEPTYNLVYRPGERVIANFKTYPSGAKYCGFGEKPGSTLLKNEFTMTQFNFDNFAYHQSPLPPDNQGGPLNPSEALYTSIPLLIETNPSPSGDFAGAAYSYGIFFDNPAQSYFNIGTNDYSIMNGKYYFGALFGDLDYYFFLADRPAGVLAQYTTLTGRSPMPPKYVFGFHQGAYGYYNRQRLEKVAQDYRNAQFPIDGLHIDVDFQDNYRTFTHSERKFPQAQQMLANLRQNGFKCSTNITPVLTDNDLDEYSQVKVYPQRKALADINGLIFNTRAGQAVDAHLFVGNVNYGLNRKVNPDYGAYPPLQPNSDGYLPLTPHGYYPDLGRADVRTAWGAQYDHLINYLGLEMIWQDMTCPALDHTGDTPFRTFPGDLMHQTGQVYAPNASFHNGYANLLVQATWEGLRQLRPTMRNFIIARGGYAGVQRYAALWSGDSASTWPFLRINIPEVLNWGLSGIPITGCDIGGFANVNDIPNGTAQAAQYPGGSVIGGITNYELLTRWMQLGCFLPWFRNHYNGYEKQFQEPIYYGEPVPTNTRRYVQLRYRLLQLFYDAMYEWTQTGMPIARALFLNEPDDPNVYNFLNDQFFIGKDLLVAPILDQFDSLPGGPQQPRRDIYLPDKSVWYVFPDTNPLGPPIQGGPRGLPGGPQQPTLPNYVAGLDTVPLFVRGGAILPTRGLEQYVGQLAINPLTLTIYPGPADSYTLYQDDGITTRAEMNGEYRTTRIHHEMLQGGRRVRVQRLHDNFTPPETFYRIALLGTSAPTAVSAGGNAVPSVASAAALDASPVAAYYQDTTQGATLIKVVDTQVDVIIEVHF
ncbi:MAG TPA: TIM-barrel domain-containing protein [Gemmataceae bacterium]|nr:TIM-barrel domain-containing protein [Gemmataceae bacterium]